MPVKITLREADDVSIVAVEGRLTFGEGSDAVGSPGTELEFAL